MIDHASLRPSADPAGQARWCNRWWMTDDRVIAREDLDALFDALHRCGYTVVGPTVRDSTIRLAEIAGTRDLPAGVTDEQEAGRYRLAQREDAALFGFNLGPDSLKRWQLPPDRTVWRARRKPDGELTDFSTDARSGPAGMPDRIAYIGARACELHARAILERVLLGGNHPDPELRERADALIVIAVQCGEAGPTCFCASMGAGPKVTSGYDILLTELLDADHHVFIAATGSVRGEELLAEVPTRRAGSEELAAARATPARAAEQIQRKLDADWVKELLYAHLEHPEWESVAQRCLTCGNCTMVCPTCFCTSVEDVTDLTGEQVERRQQWDSCFAVDHSYMHGGGPARQSARSRYRQWMTHKLASWDDQFGTSGCVGCGRCITWCPVGIDITEEAQAIGAVTHGPARATPAKED